MRKRCLAIITICILCQSWAFAQSQFAWNSLPIGGGGFLTGLVAHPTAKDIIYARTDVGGIYRYDGTTNPVHWEQVLNWIPVSDISLWGCDGIGLNPQNENEVYALLGSYSYSSAYGIYKSTDKGSHWAKVYTTKCRANEDQRWIGEPIAVQPKDQGLIVLIGTRYNGLLRSTDGGSTWATVESIPADASGWGIRSVAFDPANPSICYASAKNILYRSTDSGISFSAILGSGTTIEMRQVRVGHDGTMYITTNSGIYKCAANGSPAKCSMPASGIDLNALSVDPKDSNRIIAGELKQGFGNRIFISTDGGSSWAQKDAGATIENHVGWYAQNQFRAALSSLNFDSGNSNKIWLTDWYLPWVCNDISQATPHYESQPWGIEELVVFDITCPPNGNLLYQGCADNGGFTHTSLSVYPTLRYGNQETTGVDFCELYPNSLVRVSSSGWGTNSFMLSTSTDGGKTWNNGVGGKITTTGKVAMSSKNPLNFIFIPTGSNKNLYYTTDGGKTAMKVSDLPLMTFNSDFWDNWNKPITADRINGNKFYAVNNRKLYISENGGVNWTLQNSLLPAPGGTPGYYLVASPYSEGTLWLSSGSGLRYSSNSGATFSTKGSFKSTKMVAVGPPLTGNNPIIYVYGLLNNVWGVYWSQDNGTSWERINDDMHQMSNNPRQMSADRNRPGRVYIGTGGTGIYYGECPLPSDIVATPVISPAGGSISHTDIVSITDAADGAIIYYTTDGSNPDSSSSKYSAPFEAGNAVTVKAIAIKQGLVPSAIATANYQNPSGAIVNLSSGIANNIQVIKIDSSKWMVKCPFPSNKIFIELFNLQGEKVSVWNTENAGEYPLDLSSFPNGLYILKAKSGNLQINAKLLKTSN